MVSLQSIKIAVTSCFPFTVSRFRKDSQKTEEKNPLQLEHSLFREIFRDTMLQTLKNVKESKYRNIKASVHGGGIILIASTAAEADQNTHEALLSKFYELMYDEVTISYVTKTIRKIESTEGLPVRQFVAIINRQLIEDLIRSRAKVYANVIKVNADCLTSADRSVLFYICGYIIKTLENKLKTKDEFYESISNMLQKESDSEKTFVSKYAEWTDVLNRGGLKKPSDNFFLFI